LALAVANARQPRMGVIRLIAQALVLLLRQLFQPKRVDPSLPRQAGPGETLGRHLRDVTLSVPRPQRVECARGLAAALGAGHLRLNLRLRRRARGRGITSISEWSPSV